MVLRKCLHHTVQLALSFEGLRQLAQVYLSLSVSGIVRPLNEPRAEQDPYYIRQYKDNKDPPPPPPPRTHFKKTRRRDADMAWLPARCLLPRRFKGSKGKSPPPPIPRRYLNPIDPKPQPLNPKPLSPKPQTRNPKP